MTLSGTSDGDQTPISGSPWRGRERLRGKEGEEEGGEVMVQLVPGLSLQWALTSDEVTEDGRWWRYITSTSG